MATRSRDRIARTRSLTSGILIAIVPSGSSRRGSPRSSLISSVSKSKANDHHSLDLRARSRRRPRPRFAAATLHGSCSGPCVTDRSRSSWPRCHGSPGTIGCPQRQQHTSPRATAGAHLARRRRCSLPYPRAAVGALRRPASRARLRGIRLRAEPVGFAEVDLSWQWGDRLVAYE